MSQADLTHFRWLHFDSVATTNAANPVDGTPGNGGTAPQILMSPFTQEKLPTTGFLIMLKTSALLPAATPGAGGFLVTIWLRDPSSTRWAAFAGASIGFDQLFVTYDVDAGALYFQIGNVSVDGALEIGLAEQ